MCKETTMDRGILENNKRPVMFIMTIALIVLFLVLICVGRYPISPFRAFEIIGRSFIGKTDGMDVYESSVYTEYSPSENPYGNSGGGRAFCFWRDLSGRFRKSTREPGYSRSLFGSWIWRGVSDPVIVRHGCYTGDRTRLRPSGSGDRSEPITHQEAQRTVRAGAIGRYCEVHV